MEYKDLPKEIKSPITGDTLKLQDLVSDNGDQLVVASTDSTREMFWWGDIATYKSESKETIHIPIGEL